MLYRTPLIIFSDHLLYPSETFIRSQAEAMQRFVPYYVGSRRVHGVQTPADRTLLLNRGSALGRLREIPFKLWGLAPTLARRIENLNPALVHAHYGPNGLRVLPLARALDKPLVVTFHGSDANIKDAFTKHLNYGHRVYARRKSILQRNGALFIAVSDFIRAKLIDQGFPADRTITHYIGIDTNVFHPDDASKRQPVVLFVGRLIENKGVPYLIRAMSHVQNELPDAELVVIGDGVLRAQLEQAAKSSLRKYRFLGMQPHEVVRDWMRIAKVVVQPSITLESGGAEGLPIVLGEAQAMGIPVVSSRMAGIPEVVQDGASGFLVEERDWRSLAAGIAMLFTDEALWHRFSREGRRKICAEFDLHQQTEKLEMIYDSVVEKSHRANQPAPMNVQ